MKLFITGTDTDAGKTYVSCALLKALNKANLSTIALKPLSSGCQMTPQGWRNEDALLLQKHANIELPYSLVNPLAFEQPVAPFIPAKINGIKLDVQTILASIQPALSMTADVHLIEGVGGWLMPLNATATMADVAHELQASIVMVVGMRLGCLNHALLTYEAIRWKNKNPVAWVANCIDPNMQYIEENIALLRKKIDAPLLSVIQQHGDIDYLSAEFRDLIKELP